MQQAQENTDQDSAVKSPTTPEKSTEEWIADWRTWVQSHPSRAVFADDSRESIYEGRGK